MNISAYAHFVQARRWWVILFCLFLIALAATGLTRLKLSTNLEVFFEPGDPQLIAYDAVRDTYTRDDNIFLVFAPADGQVFTPENLAMVEQITAAAWEIPYAMRVDSVSNFQHTEADGDDLRVSPLVDNALNMSASGIARAREVAVNEPLLRGRIITPEAHLTAINVTIQLPNIDRSSEIPAVVEAARLLRQQVQQAMPGADLKITGKVAGNFSFTEAALDDLGHIVPLALLIALLAIAGFLYFASGSALMAVLSTLATIAIIIGSVVIGMGLAGWLGIEVSPPVSNAPTVILTLAVADCMHLLMSFFQARRGGKAPEGALRHALKLNVQPVFLTSLTTVIGFLALNFSDAPPFHDLGNVVALGIVAAWLLSMSLLPALLSLMPARDSGREVANGDGMRRLADAVLQRPRAYLIGVLAVIAMTVTGLPRNELYDVWAEYFDERTQIRQDSDFAREHLNGFNTLEFDLGSGEAGGVVDPAYLQTLEDFSNWLRAQPEVKHVSTFSDVMKRLNRNMHGDDEAWYRLPEQRDLAAQYLLLYEFSLPFGLDLTNQVNLDKSSTRLIANLRESSTQDVLALQARAVEWQRANAPESFYHPGASSDAMFAHTGLRNVKSMLLGSFLGLLAISAVIAVALRSLRFGVLSLLLNLLPMLVGFGVWGLLVGRIGMGLSVVTGLTMGIVVDFTVHLLSKYKQGQQDNGLSTEDAIRYAFSTVGAALVVTTIVLIINFGLLAFSVFALNAEMGMLTAGIILVALLIDLFLLPPMLLLLGRQRGGLPGYAPGTADGPVVE